MENINSWQDIQWNTIEKRVFHLQLRIFKAAVNQDLNKVHKLQKRLVSSKSAKYLSVRKVTQDNIAKKTDNIDNQIISSSIAKFALANKLMLNEKSSSIRKIYISKLDGSQYPLSVLTSEDRAKQMLAYIALCPQWEALFEESSSGFKSRRSILDFIDLELVKKPKWVLKIDISKCFNQINYSYLVDKCNTFPEMKKQIRVWLKTGILDGLETAQGEVMSLLLTNIALHGLRDSFNAYLNTIPEYSPNNRQILNCVRYITNFVLIYSNKDTLEDLKEVIKKFFEPIGLNLKLIKTQLVHSLETIDGRSPGFSVLGFDVIQVRKRRVFLKNKLKKNVITLITPSKDSIRNHMLKIREIIQKYRGTDQENLIKRLNPLIRKWVLSNRTQMSRKTFQNLDRYIFIHLWKWARKRHPKMSKYKLKEKYWHQIRMSNWRFGVKKKGKVLFQLQLHSKITIQRYEKVKNIRPKFSLMYNSNCQYFINEKLKVY